MKELKFRVWDIASKEMLYEGDPLLDNLPLKCLYPSYRNKALIFMLYTELKDKNGKEIFEGDIVNYLDRTWVELEGSIQEYMTRLFLIEWHDYCWNFKEKTLGNWIRFPISEKYGISLSQDLEIIGNKYENPELLEQK